MTATPDPAPERDPAATPAPAKPDAAAGATTPAPPATSPAAPASDPAAPPGARPQETGGPKGPEPTRYGDWERDGRCVDF